MRGSTPKCLKHSTKMCELHCEYCDVPIFAQCVSSGEHEQHGKGTIFNSLSRKKELLQRDLDELEESIYTSSQEAASSILVQRADIGKHSRKL